MSDKPDIRESMILSLIVPKESEDLIAPGQRQDYFWARLKSTDELAINFILKLGRINVRNTNKKIYLTIKDVPQEIRNSLPQIHFKRGVLSITDDPRVEWGGDWSDLGCFRLAFKMVELDAKIESESIVLSCQNAAYEKDMVTPDKCRVLLEVPKR